MTGSETHAVYTHPSDTAQRQWRQRLTRSHTPQRSTHPHSSQLPIGAAGNGGGGSGGGNGGGGGGGGEGGAESGGRCGEATGRADTVAATGRGRQAALHLGHHCVSEEGSRGRERSECLTPKGSSAERAREVMTTSSGCSEATKLASGIAERPCSLAQPTVPVSRPQTDSEETAPGVEQAIQYL